MRTYVLGGRKMGFLSTPTNYKNVVAVTCVRNEELIYGKQQRLSTSRTRLTSRMLN